MHISISQKFHPFSHEPGIFCLIPRTSIEVQVFPTLLYFKDLDLEDEKQKLLSLRLSLKGPFKNFTVEQNLEKYFLRIFGFSRDGYFCYYLQKIEEGICFYLEKTPHSVEVIYSFSKKVMERGDRFFLPLSYRAEVKNLSKEKLSLGMHKSQEWLFIKHRCDLREIFPFWIRLAALTPNPTIFSEERKGLFSLLDLCKEAIDSSKRNEIASLFRQFFQTAFQGILSPRLKDEHFLGIVSDVELFCSATCMLHESAKLIRMLFFREEKDSIFLLPSLPTEFHCGRMINIELKNGALLDIEWSKKLLKKVIWRSTNDESRLLILQKPLKSFRVRSSMKDRGVRVSCNHPLELRANQLLYLDRFEK